MYYVYFIKSTVKNWVYVGSTSNIEKRLEQHNKGEVQSTQFYKPFTLIYTETYTTVAEARKREKEIKTNRCKKDDIIKSLK